MIWLRSALFNAAFFGMTAVMAAIGLPLLLLPRGALWTFARFWVRLVLWLLRLLVGIRVRVSGAEHLPDGPGLVAAQHQSAFDTIIWLALLPRPAVVLKRELLRIPIYGWFCRKFGMIPIDRTAGGAAIRALLRGADAAVAAGRPVLIFPEGTRTEPGAQHPFQPGVAALARRIGGAVVPVATDSGRHWGRRAFRKLPGTISIAVLPPIPVTADRDHLVAQLESAIAEGFRQLSADSVDNSVSSAPSEFGRHPRSVS